MDAKKNKLNIHKTLLVLLIVLMNVRYLDIFDYMFISPILIVYLAGINQILAIKI